MLQSLSQSQTDIIFWYLVCEWRLITCNSHRISQPVIFYIGAVLYVQFDIQKKITAGALCQYESFVRCKTVSLWLMKVISKSINKTKMPCMPPAPQKGFFVMAVMHLRWLKLERLLQSVSNKTTTTGKALQPHCGSCVSRDYVSYTLENTTRTQSSCCICAFEEDPEK